MGVKKKMKNGAVIFAVLAVCFQLCCAQDDTSEIKLRIEPEEESLPRAAGDSLAVTCIGEAIDPNLFTEMKWSGPAGEIGNNEKDPITVTNLEKGKLLLVFNEPTPEMSGKYTCTAVYDNSIAREDSVVITFYHSISYENCPEQQAVIIGREGRISCQVNANPAAVVQWYKSGHILDKDTVVLENDGIVIKEVKESDAGTYRIRALVQSTGSLKWKEIKVEVHVPPVIDEEMEESVEVVDGGRKEIRCKASGFPSPMYSWFNPRQQNLSDVDNFIVDRTTGTLTFRQVLKEDAGRYKCVASNGAGTVEHFVNVMVIVKPEIRQFNNISSQINVDATLECRVTGDPAPDITIRKDGHDQPFSNGEDRYGVSVREDNGEHVLKFIVQRVTRFDDGLYYCAAENSGGRVERVGHLEVQFPPDMSSTPNTERKTWNENPVNLSCIAEAIPNASIQWFFRNHPIQPSQIYYIYGDVAYSYLLVKPSSGIPGGLDVYGKYRCEARNQYGNSSVEIDLQEARAPGKLQQSNFDKYTATTITFLLRGPKDDGGLPVKEFVAEYREKDDPNNQLQTRSWLEGTPYILENLIPRKAYVFRFAAKNDAGVGDWGEELDFVMPAESTPEIPVITNQQSGTKTSTYPDSYTIRWKMPQNNGRPIDFFTLRYFQVEPEGQEWKQTGQDTLVELKDISGPLKHKIEGLRPDTLYKVELRAHNEIGFSQHSTIVFKTSTGADTPDDQPLEQGGGILTTPAIVAIIIVVILIILGLLDVTCYLKYRCGLFYCLRTNVCGHSPASEKVNDGAIEDGKGKDQAQKARKLSDGELATEETPMIDTPGAKDTKPTGDQDLKNKSPKGSKSSIAKDSLV